MRYTWFILISFVAVTQMLSGQDKSEASSPSSSLSEVLSQISTYEKTLTNSAGLWRGRHPIVLTTFSEEDYQEQKVQYTYHMEQLTAIDKLALSSEDRISYETMELKLKGIIDQLEYKLYLIPFNAEGGFYNSIARAMERLPFSDATDYDAYLGWLPTYKGYIEENMKLLQLGIQEGVVAPKVIVGNAIQHIQSWKGSDLSEHPLTAKAMASLEGLSDAQRAKYTRDIQVTMSQIWPVYHRLEHFLSYFYMEAAYEAPGISEMPRGKEYYENRADYFTTLNMTPDEIYQRGEEEVARIKKQMEEIIVQVGYEGSFDSFIQMLREDERFYADTPEELLSRAAWLSKKAEGQLPRLFKYLYKIPFTVEPVPDEIAPTYTSGRYVRGSRSQDRPGIYWVNTYDLKSRPLYNLPALTVHEAVPGHHLQIMLAAELDSIAAFRKSFYISAFGEGWGLYSEYLGEEMGMYEDPYDRFGRYTYEMWRACRLVVDVGLHYKGWTRQEAIDFLAGNTALSVHEVTTEIDRYIGWPGQALSYKIGELTIKDLRKRAEKELGDRFDIQEFHHRILKNGSVPLPTLIREIESWIKNAKE